MRLILKSNPHGQTPQVGFTITPKTNLTKSETKPLTLDQLPIFFDLKNIEIQKGSIIFVDQVHGLSHQLKQFNFQVPQITNISNDPENQTEIALNFILNKFQMEAKIQGNIFQKTPTAKINLKNKGGDFSFYQPYLSSILNWELSSGQLKSDIGIFIELINNTPDFTIQGKVQILNFELKENSKQSLISFPLLEIQIDETRPLKPQVNLSLVKNVQPKIQITRRKDQSLNWIPIFKKQQKAKSSPPPGHPSKDASEKTESQPKETSVLDIQVKEILIEKGMVRITDASLPEPFEAQLQNLQLKLKQINLLDQTIPFIKFQTEIAPHGKIALKGAVDLQPLRWDGSVFIEDFDISMAQPYLKEFLNGCLENGRLFMQLDTFFEQKKEHPQVTLSGKLSLNHFIFREPVNMDELLTWEKFEFKQINLGIFPHYVEIDEVRLSRLNVPLFINAEGNLNWLALMKNQDINAPLDAKNIAESAAISEVSESSKKYSSVSGENTSPTPLQRLKIHKIVMDESTIRFVDKTIKPFFQAQMTQLNGQISGIDQEITQPMNFVLNGKLNDLSPLKIIGSIAPFQKPLSLKVKLSLQGIEVPPFTPYTHHYIGYPLDKGQLTLGLDYQIERNQLISTNKVLINQLDLGKKDKMADVPQLPLEFALALLKDREGKIQFSIPIEGDLDSLDISFKDVILQTLKNLLERTVTAPFTFLSQLFGNGNDLRSMDFDYGKNDLRKSTQEKLKQVANMLLNRPLLKLTLNSHLNEKEERKALKEARLQHELELLKFKEQTPKQESLKEPRHVTLTDEEYDQYLIELYQVRFKKIPVPELLNRHSLKQALLSSIAVVSEDFESLAQKRMVKIRNTLVDEYQVQPDRIFISEKKSSAKELKNVTQSQVILKLQ